jgi:hypothetical protein
MQNTINMVLWNKQNTLTFASKFRPVKTIATNTPVIMMQMCECVRMSMCMRWTLHAGAFIIER